MDHEPTSESRSKPADLRTVLPPRWREREGAGYASAYLMPGFSLADLSPPFAVDLGDVCVVMGWFGWPRHRIESVFAHSTEGGIQIRIGGEEGQVREPAPSSLFVTALEGADVVAAQVRIHEAVALLSAIESMILVLQHIEDYHVTFPNVDAVAPASTMILDNLWWDGANVDPEARARWATAASAVASHPETERIGLSLRWYDEAKRDRGVDAFVKLWFALETLSGAESGEKVPNVLRDSLAAVYGLNSKEAGERFGLGRIYGLRTLIVHQGQRIAIPAWLLSYLGGVYVDLLVLMLGHPSGRRAQAALDVAGGVLNVLPARVGGRGEEADAEYQERKTREARAQIDRNHSTEELGEAGGEPSAELIERGNAT